MRRQRRNGAARWKPVCCNLRRRKPVPRQMCAADEAGLKTLLTDSVGCQPGEQGNVRSWQQDGSEYTRGLRIFQNYVAVDRATANAGRRRFEHPRIYLPVTQRIGHTRNPALV